MSRDLALIKVSATSEHRSEIMQLVDVFRARIVDVTNDSLIIEITGDEEKIDGFVEVMRPFGILEMVRTGVVAWCADRKLGRLNSVATGTAAVS